MMAIRFIYGAAFNNGNTIVDRTHLVVLDTGRVVLQKDRLKAAKQSNVTANPSSIEIIHKI